MDILNSESTRDIKDPTRKALLEDVSSDEDIDKIASSNEEHGIEDDNNKRSKDSFKKLSRDKELEEGKTSLVKPDDLKGREALLADNSSSDGEEGDQSSLSVKENEKGRRALLADRSSDEEIPSETEIKQKNHNKIKRKASEDKENLKSKGTTKKSSRDKVRSSEGVEGKVNGIKDIKQAADVETENSDAGEDTGAVGFIVLGEYNEKTNEINKLDDDILVQLDGAGKQFEDLSRFFRVKLNFPFHVV